MATVRVGKHSTQTLAADDAPGEYAFLAVYRGATLHFTPSASSAEDLALEMSALFATEGTSDHEARDAMREILRNGFVDSDHLDPAKSQTMLRAIIWLCLTSRCREINPQAPGFIVEITDRAGGDSNFRFIAASSGEMVSRESARHRKGRNYVAQITARQAERAVNRKRTPPPRDPSLEPPPRPRPDRWLPALEEAEKRFGRAFFVGARHCIEAGASFVWKSRPVADTAIEEVDASLGAMAEYGRLNLPFPAILAETRDWIDVPSDDAPPRRVAARFCVAAYEHAGGIRFNVFSDYEGSARLSVVAGEIDVAALIRGKRLFGISRPPIPPDMLYEESRDRREVYAGGDRLLELLFLLSTAGVAREKVTQGSGRAGKRSKRQLRMSERDYTVVRVPMTWVPGQEDSSDGGRWVRPHARRAHMWGKNARPLEEQHWRDACLVGASKVGEDAEIRRPEYRVG